MAHDLVIRNGTVVDGTGAAPRSADLAIDNGMITAIGRVTGTGAEEINAEGNAVTPGFVDLHTHLDAQIGWDPMLTPISWHGVTTALLGNCGVTFAPCKPADRDFVAGMMETVEDIPKDAILSGLPWTWESYGGYLDALEQLQPAINVAGLVGHCAVRYYVMGERGITDQPTEAEKQEIARVVADSIKAGAVGFSTSRFLGHVIPDGRHVPGTHAQHDELVAIATAVGRQNGLMQNVLNLGGDFEGEAELLREEARASGGRVLFSITAGAKENSGRRVRTMLEEMHAEGLDINAIAIPRGSGFVTGLQCRFPWRSDAWSKLAMLDFDGRLAAIDNTDFAATLVAEAQAQSGIPASDLFWLGDGVHPRYADGPETSLHHLAAQALEHPAETFLRMARESKGQALFTLRAFNKNLKALANLISCQHCNPGLGDAGAHVSQIMDAGWATFVLSHWHREAGLYSLEEAVRRLTSAPARILGMSDRGILQPGLRADLNVIDVDRVSELMPRIVHDFPGGAARFEQRAVGYQATICNGTVILRNDEHTGARAGRVVRHRG